MLDGHSTSHSLREPKKRSHTCGKRNQQPHSRNQRKEASAALLEVPGSVAVCQFLTTNDDSHESASGMSFGTDVKKSSSFGRNSMQLANMPSQHNLSKTDAKIEFCVLFCRSQTTDQNSKTQKHCFTFSSLSSHKTKNSKCSVQWHIDVNALQDMSCEMRLALLRSRTSPVVLRCTARLFGAVALCLQHCTARCIHSVLSCGIMRHCGCVLCLAMRLAIPDLVRLVSHLATLGLAVHLCRPHVVCHASFCAALLCRFPSISKCLQASKPPSSWCLFKCQSSHHEQSRSQSGFLWWLLQLQESQQLHQPPCNHSPHPSQSPGPCGFTVGKGFKMGSPAPSPIGITVPTPVHVTNAKWGPASQNTDLHPHLVIWNKKGRTGTISLVCETETSQWPKLPQPCPCSQCWLCFLWLQPMCLCFRWHASSTPW